jgi:hypothetical protein
MRTPMREEDGGVGSSRFAEDVDYLASSKLGGSTASAVIDSP